MTITPCIGFELRCRILGCQKRMVVHVTRFSDPRMPPLETVALSPHAGWTLMFRQRDDHTMATAALCPEHVGKWEDDA